MQLVGHKVSHILAVRWMPLGGSFLGGFDLGDVERRAGALDGGEGVARLHAAPMAHTMTPYERFVKPVLDRVAGVVLSEQYRWPPHLTV